MSVNWVMLHPTNPESFVRLPGEQILHSSPTRVSLSLDSINRFPGRQPFNMACASGRVHLTNRRIIYLSSTPHASPSATTSTNDDEVPKHLASFAAPLSHLHDAHVTTPWLGPNAWVCIAQPVAGGGIPGAHAAVEARMTFKDGGAYDMHTRFCEVRERLAQVRSDVGADAAVSSNGTGAESAAVHLEQLPAYEENPSGVRRRANRSGGGGSDDAENGESTAAAATGTAAREDSSDMPAEPPPGYEEAQRDGVADMLERSLRMSTR